MLDAVNCITVEDPLQNDPLYVTERMESRLGSLRYGRLGNLRYEKGMALFLLKGPPDMAR